MAARNDVWTIGSILKWTEQYFQDKGVESPRLDAEVLLSHVLDKERIYLYVHFDEPMEAKELAAYKELIKKRIARVPVAYILGYKEFMGLAFAVTPAVLIPRPDTEILAEAVIERLEKKESPSFADIGTGSGAVALSVLANVPEARGSAVDISPDALAVAKKNAGALGVADRVGFYCGDLCEPLAKKHFDAIVSNPPYIPDGDIAGLSPEVRKEPYGALAGGADGLDFYRRLVQDGAKLLKPDGFMAFEVGIRQAKRVEALAKEAGRFSETRILKDYAGIERVVIMYK